MWQAAIKIVNAIDAMNQNALFMHGRCTLLSPCAKCFVSHSVPPGDVISGVISVRSAEENPRVSVNTTYILATGLARRPISAFCRL